MSEPAWWESFNHEVRRREQAWSERQDEKLSKIFMDEYNKTMKETPVTRPTHDDYLNLIQGRLRQGAKEYGDRSFDKQLSKIVEEMIEEIADVAGWGYILYCKLIDLRGMMVALESPDPRATLGDYLTPEPTKWYMVKGTGLAIKADPDPEPTKQSVAEDTEPKQQEMFGPKDWKDTYRKPSK